MAVFSAKSKLEGVGVSRPTRVVVKAGRVDGAHAEERFMAGLAGVTDPEKKRKFIGGEFINVFEEEAKKIGGADFTVGARYAVGSFLGEATIGRFGGLAVFNRPLTDAEIPSLHEAANLKQLD